MSTSKLYRYMDKKKPWWGTKRWIFGFSVGAGVIIALGVIRWVTLPAPRHFWPALAEDWTAWGTFLGAIGTILAVIYAARTLRSTSEAQLNEQRDRRLQMDFLDAKEGEEANRLQPNVKGFPREIDEWGSSDDATGARIYVQNFSDHSFHEVQVFVPKNSLQDGGTLSDIEFWEADLVHTKDRGTSPGKWSKIESPGVSLPGENLFNLGTVKTRKCRGVSFNFSTYEAMLDWDTRSYDAVENFGREVLLAVTFVDRNAKTWQRTSRDYGKIVQLRRPELE